MSGNSWTQEYRARKHHKCDSRDSTCAGEICPGEFYVRVAQLNKSLPTYEGESPCVLDPAVVVHRYCIGGCGT